MSADSPFRSHRKHKLKAEINVVPFIDVMLVLLVIFMITVPVIYSVEKADLIKEEDNKKNKSNGPSAVISVVVLDAQKAAIEGYTYRILFKKEDIREQKASQDIVFEEIKKIAIQNPNSEVHIFGDLNAQYEDVAGLLFRQIGRAHV